MAVGLEMEGAHLSESDYQSCLLRIRTKYSASNVKSICMHIMASGIVSLEGDGKHFASGAEVDTAYHRYRTSAPEAKCFRLAKDYPNALIMQYNTFNYLKRETSTMLEADCIAFPDNAARFHFKRNSMQEDSNKIG